MLIGHIAVAFAAKAVKREASLPHLMLAANLSDVLWIVLVMFGVEKFTFQESIKESNNQLWYLIFERNAISHGFIPALVLSVLVFFFYQKYFGRHKTFVVSAVIACVSFSHWVLDLIVHRSDLPVGGPVPNQGWGLWESLRISLTLEVLVFVTVFSFYLLRTNPAPETSAKQKYVYWIFFGLVLFQVAISFWPGLFVRQQWPFLISFAAFIGITVYLGHFLERLRFPSIGPFDPLPSKSLNKHISP
jgi:membrane-bound metal-dependent hydrolase YbcI (DUF457 family)